MEKLALVVDRETQINIANSRAPDGGSLARVEKWTRTATGYNPASRTLNRTGTLKRSHKPKELSDEGFRYGPSGKQIPIAERLFKGGPSRMKVDPDRVRHGRNGPYIRIRTNSGQWRTKKVNADGTVSIRLKPRPYIGISDTMQRKIEEVLLGNLGL